MSLVTKEQQELGNRLYETYAKPLEADHYGEYIAIASDGRFVLGATDVDTIVRANKEFGPGVFLFRVGERVMGRLRWLSR